MARAELREAPRGVAEVLGAEFGRQPRALAAEHPHQRVVAVALLRERVRQHRHVLRLEALRGAERGRARRERLEQRRVLRAARGERPRQLRDVARLELRGARARLGRGRREQRRRGVPQARERPARGREVLRPRAAQAAGGGGRCRSIAQLGVIVLQRGERPQHRRERARVHLVRAPRRRARKRRDHLPVVQRQPRGGPQQLAQRGGRHRVGSALGRARELCKVLLLFCLEERACIAGCWGKRDCITKRHERAARPSPLPLKQPREDSCSRA